MRQNVNSHLTETVENVENMANTGVKMGDAELGIYGDYGEGL